MSSGSVDYRASPATFRFTNLGPVRDASLELGRLTVIAGRNNTGKTYITDSLYGFLKTWEDWPGAPQCLFEAPSDFPSINGIAETLLRKGRAVIPLPPAAIQHQRRMLLEKVALAFSEESLPEVFGSQRDGFRESSLRVEVDELGAYWDPRPSRMWFRRTAVSLQYDGARLVASIGDTEPLDMVEKMELHTASAYYRFLLRGLFPDPFILSPDRSGVSLFHRELDFTKSHLVEVLQKMGDEGGRKSVSPILFLDGRSSRHTLAVNDNIDFTRHIADLRGEVASVPDRRLVAGVRNIAGGYYGSVGDDLRFISKARGKGRSFNIPLHLASSSARGLSDLYFYLRHEAALGQLLIIGEPESHLDTRNQVLFARLLARFVTAGLRVLITTHSDYLVKELNNLLMLSGDFPGKIALARKLGYKSGEGLDPMFVRAYVAENNGLTQCEIGPFGIEMPVFDETIDSINNAATELSSRAAKLVDGKGRGSAKGGIRTTGGF